MKTQSGYKPVHKGHSGNISKDPVREDRLSMDYKTIQHKWWGPIVRERHSIPLWWSVCS